MSCTNPIMIKANDGSGYMMVPCGKCNCWDKGRVHVGYVTRASSSYVARYTMKKVNGKPKQWYIDKGIEPEFVLMSLKPGIGLSFMEKYKEDILNHDAVYVDGIKFRVPRYYSKKLGLSDTIGYELKQKDKFDEQMRNLSKMSANDWLKSGVDKQNEREQRSRNNKKFMEQKGR